MRRIRSPCCVRPATGHAAAPAEQRDELDAFSLDHLVGECKQCSAALRGRMRSHPGPVRMVSRYFFAVIIL